MVLQLIQVAGANVRVVQSQKTDPSFSYNTAEVRRTVQTLLRLVWPRHVYVLCADEAAFVPCGLPCVQVIYSPNVPIHGGAARVALPPGNGSGHVGLKPDAEAMNTDDQAEGGVVRRLYGWLG